MRQPGSSKQPVRNAFLADDIGSVTVSIWKDNLDKAYSIHLQQQNCASWIDLCYLLTDLLKLIHVVHLLLQKLRNLVFFFFPSALNGNVNIHPICNNPLCKKQNKKQKQIDCTRRRNSRDVSSLFQEAFAKKTVIDIKIDINQNGKVTAVTVFPLEITNVFVEETLRVAKGNLHQLLEKFLLLENHDFFLSNFQ